MLPSFSEHARRVLRLARSCAVKLKSCNIEAEHILYGLVRVEDTDVFTLLKECGITVEKLTELLYKAEIDDRCVPVEKPSYGEDVLAIMRSAINYDQKVGGFVEPVLLLLGILDFVRANPHCYLAELFALMNADMDKLNKFYEAFVEENGCRQKDVLRGPSSASDSSESSSAGSGGSEEGRQDDSASAQRRTRVKRGVHGNTPILDKFGFDYTKQAREGKLSPAVGRDDERERIIMVLLRKNKNNPILLGDPGVGKTAILEDLALHIVRGDVPKSLQDKRLVGVPMASLVAGTRYRGEFEERMNKLLDEVKQSNGGIIMILDEIHTIMGAGDSDGAMDAANILKPVLSQGQICCIGATTLEGYRKHIEKDGALARRFQRIDIKEPTPKDTIRILQSLRPRLEEHHNVDIADIALEKAVALSVRFINDRYLPDKAIDLLDEASSWANIRRSAPPADVVSDQKKLQELSEELDSALQSGDYDAVAQCREREARLQESLDSRLATWREARRDDQDQQRPVVGVDAVANVVAKWTGVPLNSLLTEETERLRAIEEKLHERVVGQAEPVKVVGQAIKRSRTGLKDPKKPIGSFLFLGPTGVGKTELAKALAEYLFDDEKSLIRLDMSEYQDRFDITRMLGSAPGYVGYEEGGQLSNQVRRNPYSVVLFDEIEKAHPDIFNTLLQILDDGRLTDAQGHEVDFKNTVIILTSNVGFELGGSGDSEIGFRGSRQELDPAKKFAHMQKKVLEDAKKIFRPEFLNRLDAQLVFHSLEKEHLLQIVEIMLKNVAKELKANRNIDLEFTPESQELLVSSCNEPQYGARPLRRAIQAKLENPLADNCLNGEYPDGCTILVDVDPEDPESLAFSVTAD